MSKISAWSAKTTTFTMLLVALLGAGGYVWYQNAFAGKPVEPSVLGTQKPIETCTPVLLSTNTPSILTTTNRQWYLKGAEFKEDSQSIQLTTEVSNLPVECQDKPIVSTYKVATLEGTLNRINDTTRFTATIPSKSLTVGKPAITVETAIQVSETERIPLETTTASITLSYPVYVAWTIDWEGFPIQQAYLDKVASIANKRQMPLTHFFNPRYFISKSISSSQRKQYTNWVLDRQKKNQDAIGLHLHMFTDLVAAAGVEPHTTSNWGNRVDGYDVPFSSYSYEDQKKILQFGRDTLTRNGLPKPTMFRAGGWYANNDTMRILSELGFQADSSGRTAYSFGPNKIQGNWLLKTTTQPYWVCKGNQNTACPTTSRWPILEMPNNGADSWAFSAPAMIDRFKDNYSKKPVNKHAVVTYISHPEWFNTDDPKIKELFAYIDKYTYNQDAGPVQYVTLQTIYNAWKANKY